MRKLISVGSTRPRSCEASLTGCILPPQTGAGSCDFFRTKDPVNEPYERIEGSMTYWDPNLFADDDGRVYFYWGCDNRTPIRGIELDSETMKPAGSPLGPFSLAENNPYSYHPGGFFPGAGHGSTMQDRNGFWWHTATMRISRNHLFERRVGIWPAGFDADGNLFCNQRYGDCQEHRIGALVKNQYYFVRVDAFNRNGFTEGSIIKLS